MWREEAATYFFGNYAFFLIFRICLFLLWVGRWYFIKITISLLSSGDRGRATPSKQNKTHTHTKKNHRIIFNLTFYTMSQFPITLHTSFCVQLNCNCFLYLERVWLLNLKPFILGVLVVSGGIKRVRGWREGGGFFSFRTCSFPHSLLSSALPGARPQKFLLQWYSLIILTSPLPICFNRILTNCTY